ncbi:Arylsulfatase A [Halomicrobium sp. LC1Hm]|nr:Arylsulfatase A [Halomicrobium sp. LC1Hm]
MNEASPYFDGNYRTIADIYDTSKQSTLISVNPFLFNGLHREFGTVDKLMSEEYLIFEGGTNPRTFGAKNRTLSRAERYWKFLFQENAPFRSFVNGVAFKLWHRLDKTVVAGERSDSSGEYQQAEIINDRIEAAVDQPDDSFVLANYMDVHPPFDVTDESLERFADDWDREELPIGNSARDADTFNQKAMYDLYLSAVADLDRRITPLIRSLINNGVTVFVTSDHGPWFATEALDEERLNVPLIIFDSEEPARTVDHTVSLRALPHTTERLVHSCDSSFPGYDLLDVTTDQTVVSEHVHRDTSGRGPFTADEGTDTEITNDIVVREGTDYVTRIDGHWKSSAAEEIAVKLREHAESVLSHSPTRDGTVMHGSEMKERLEDLGYI